jgi:hypothetical protein
MCGPNLGIFNAQAGDISATTLFYRAKKKKNSSSILIPCYWSFAALDIGFTQFLNYFLLSQNYVF